MCSLTDKLKGKWKPIDKNTPKDGRIIYLTTLDADGNAEEIFSMHWDHTMRNGMFPEVVGMWAAPDGSFTWNTHPRLGGGPTHWCEQDAAITPMYL